MSEYIEREAVLIYAKMLVHTAYERKEKITDDEIEKLVYGIHADFTGAELGAIPTADVPPALWTDAPIVGTEFMTHSQGQGGFEIHFRTDSREKYETVQEECRRQIDHTKPAADVVAVRPSHWVYDGYGEFHCHACKTIWHITEGTIDDLAFCPNCGAKMDGGADDDDN